LSAGVSLAAIDTGVLIEYIDELGDFHIQATAVLESVTAGRLTAIIPHLVFAELYYVSCRIYEKFGGRDDASPESRASNLIGSLYRSPNISVPENSLEFALEAGRIKQKFNLALPDSYVIASAKLNRCDAVFKSLEDEMERGGRLARLKKETKVGLVFLEDFA